MLGRSVIGLAFPITATCPACPGVPWAGRGSRAITRSRAIQRRWWPGTESNRRRQPFQGCGRFLKGFALASGSNGTVLAGRSPLSAAHLKFGWEENGGQGRNRTADASLFRTSIYRLSYLDIIN